MSSTGAGFSGRRLWRKGAWPPPFEALWLSRYGVALSQKVPIARPDSKALRLNASHSAIVLLAMMLLLLLLQPYFGLHTDAACACCCPASATARRRVPAWQSRTLCTRVWSTTRNGGDWLWTDTSSTKIPTWLPPACENRRSSFGSCSVPRRL